MKTLSNLLVPIFAIIISTAAMSYTMSIFDNSTEELRTEITKKLRNLDIRNYDLTDYDIKVQFTINDKNELVVLRTDHEDLDALIKRTLNYVKLDLTDVKRNKPYFVNIKLDMKGA